MPDSGSESWRQVGTVEVLRSRVYPIDPHGGNHVLSTSVWVEPGIYPLYRKYDVHCWVMTGVLNERIEKVSTGLFGLHAGDNPVGLEVRFPSRAYGSEQLAELLAEPLCQPGPDQRLRFSFDEEVENAARTLDA